MLVGKSWVKDLMLMVAVRGSGCGGDVAPSAGSTGGCMVGDRRLCAVVCEGMVLGD